MTANTPALLNRKPSDSIRLSGGFTEIKIWRKKIKKQIFTAFIVISVLISALFIDVGNAAIQGSTTIQTIGTIVNQSTPSQSTPLTVILRGICITDLDPNRLDINSWVDSYVANHSYATAITISDMHQYGIWWYGYSFSQTNGMWMGWNFVQLKTLIDRFHSYGWKVGLETTGVAWKGQEEYNYISTQHPELAFTDANGLRTTGIDNSTASTKNPGYNKVIPDFFAKFATADQTNNISAGTRLIDLYTARLNQMIVDGISWDFWFGTDGWNGFNLQGYQWSTGTLSQCYSFSLQEENEYANWAPKTVLPSNWATLTNLQRAYVITQNATILNNWFYYWQIRFAQMYSQIRQVFVNAGKAGPFYIVGTADGSSEPGGAGNLSPAGMYNMSLLAQYNSVDYFYVDQESTAYTGSTYSIGREQAYIGAVVKMQNPNLNPIVGLQPVDWQGNVKPLWEVEQSYLAQAVNYVWYNGIQYRVSSPNVVMLQYSGNTGFKGWTQQETNELISFIKSVSTLLSNPQPVWLGPVYPIPDTKTGSQGMAWWGLNFSIAQWAWTANLQNNPQYVNPYMGTFLMDEALGGGGPQLIGLYDKMVNQLWANNKLNLWYYETVGGDWSISKVWGSDVDAQAQNAFHMTYSQGSSANYTILKGSSDPIASWISSGYEGTTYTIASPTDQYWRHGVYKPQIGFTTIAAFTYDTQQTIAMGYFKNDSSSNFLITHWANGGYNMQQFLPRDMINKMLYWVSECPVNSSEPLIDLKILKNGDSIIIPMTNQKDVGNTAGTRDGWPITSNLSVDANALGLASPANYKIYWASNGQQVTVKDWNSISITLSGMADCLVIIKI